MRALATRLLSERAFGVDILEVGYRKAAGITLSRHLAAWDVCSRNALFLTGNGVSDDHSGKNWRTGTKNFLTWAWAPTTSEPDLLAALAAGRAFFGDLARFAGTIDLWVDGACPMGSVSLSDAPARAVTATVTGIPAGGTVRLLQIVVDYASPDVPPDYVQVTTLPADDFATGPATVICANSRSSFVRVEVYDSGGLAVALSNPVWLLRTSPPEGVPAPRVC
ncbi:MAG: hypothetical protein H0V05_16500 [Euzebyaceae bacterium]|nr:hypothetical protein [Euzebyaceae bacterium]